MSAKMTWQLDPAHSRANFRVKHMLIAKVQGGFEKLSGKMAFDRENLAEAKVEATIDAKTINTRDPQRDAQLRSPDFLDVERFPSITFVSRTVERKGKNGLRVTGELTIRGVTRIVVLEVDGPSEEAKDPRGNTRIGLSAKTKIQRKDFGLKWNAALEAGGILVGDEVAISLDIQFTKQG